MTERERLVELLNAPISVPVGCDRAKVFADYLLKNGVVVLPCKVGDKVYFKNGKSGTVRSFYFCNNIECGNLWITIHGIKAVNVAVSEIGKTVFLTREEAEQALKGTYKRR